MEHEISVLLTKLNKYNDVHEDWIWLDTDDVDCSSASVDRELAKHDTYSINELFDECEGSSGRKENGKCSWHGRSHEFCQNPHSLQTS